jgi:transglutaminase-like putative cysteine protease
LPDSTFEENTLKSKQKAPERKFWASLKVLSDWLFLVVLLFTLGTVVWSVEQAQWVKPSPSFITIFVLAVFSGFVLSKSRLPALVAHVISIAVAIAVLFWQGIMLVSGTDLLSRITTFVNSIQEWWFSQVNGIPASTTLHVALIFGFLVWVIGYFSIRPLLTKHNPWIAVLLGTVAILVNLNFLKPDKHYYFFIFLVGALALIALTTFIKHQDQLAKSIHILTNRGLKVWTAVSICLIIIIVGLTWISPGFRVAAIADYSRANSPFKGSFQLFWQNFFATVPGSGSLVLMHGGQQGLRLGGTLELSDQVDYIIKSDYPTYWKTQIYDYYEPGNWKASDFDSKYIEASVDGTGNSGSTQSNSLSYTVVPQVNTDVIPTVGEFISGSIPILEKTLSPKVFEIELDNAISYLQLPPDIYNAVRTLPTVNESGRTGDRRAYIEALLPDDLGLLSYKVQNGIVQSVTITRKQPEIKDQISLTSVKVIGHQKPATINVKIAPTFTSDELKSATNTYPLQISDRYLQLPVNFSGRVKELATSITSQYLAQYDKVQAIQRYLGDLKYSLKIDTPPENVDAVEYFLFHSKSGYCTYFASAMTTMLRSVGIPARIAVGFLPGQYDSKVHSYVIRDRDYHAWTEVYFPNYGWITFDPTPGGVGVGAGDTYYVLPLGPYNPGQSSVQQPSQSPSKPVDFGRYIGIGVGVIFGIIILLIITCSIWIFSRPKSNTSMYSRMVLLASLAGLGPKRWQTALEFSNKLATSIPHNAHGIGRIIQVYVNTRYSDQHPEVTSIDYLEDTWPEIRDTLIKRWLHIEWLLEK